jgi:hypothetical protein
VWLSLKTLRSITLNCVRLDKPTRVRNLPSLLRSETPRQETRAENRRPSETHPAYACSPAWGGEDLSQNHRISSARGCQRRCWPFLGSPWFHSNGQSKRRPFRRPTRQLQTLICTRDSTTPSTRILVERPHKKFGIMGRLFRCDEMR